jgi:hypothetical protein
MNKKKLTKVKRANNMDMKLMREKYNEISKAYDESYEKFKLLSEEYNKCWNEYYKIMKERSALYDLIEEERERESERIKNEQNSVAEQFNDACEILTNAYRKREEE